MKKGILAAAAMAVTLSLAACESPNKLALKIGAPPESAAKLRAMEIRRYDTLDQMALLEAGTQTLQDLGFTISESASEVGVLVGFKHRDAEEAGEIAGQVALTVALALLGSYHAPDWDKDQTINVALVATPVVNSKQIDLRVSFDRLVRTKNGLSRSELIDDPEIYKQFFEKMSGGVFLEGHQI
ncbi:hypothetical protein CKO38_01410 [Rhodospirillum rubrum]|uniref:hypothetical protein n=1 Tax=Rhodospirillum rubrum TaxID=1085 RepID=UPI0019043ECD|nr:hypothetical protein [Rhodospirillum rubrum]MBK1663462.1 hypothetical protein [Rhodospirillum rubrum]MBK1675355.1 hypothetical protein [Rhodospirillum rubrum]